MLQIHGASADSLSDLAEQQRFIQRDTQLTRLIHEQALFIGLEACHGGGLRDGTLLLLVILHGGEEIRLVISLECELFHDVGDPILELQRLGRKDSVVLDIFVGLWRLLLDLEQLGGDGTALFLALRKNGLNVADFLGIRELLTKGNRFDGGQRITDTLTDLFRQCVQGLALVGAAGVAAFFVFALARAQGTLH